MIFITKPYKIFFIIIISFTFIIPSVSAEADFSTKPWTELKTKHTIIRYKSHNDLFKFHESVDYGPGKWNKTPLFSDISKTELKQMVSLKTDAIFERAQTILNKKKKIKKIFIDIYCNAQELKKAYNLIYRGECNVRAWYRHRNRTVYINVEDVHAGMLAHELAHGIIDHFLVVKPPAETAEILARYVDSHL
mgnify:CR=1 FL=1